MRIPTMMLIALLIFPASSYAEESLFESSTVCGECHEDIYRNWQKSLHAIAYKNPIFQTAYRRVYTSTKGAAKTICLKCHAPTTLITGDWDAELPITREGITCDFCHTVAEVDMEKKPGSRFTVKPGSLKRASIKGASSPYHDTAYSKDFSSSELCAACHDYKNPAGVHIQSAYKDWLGSSFAKEGKQCQHCHMPRIPGNTTNLKEMPPRPSLKAEGIPDHSLAHNLNTMKGAVQIKTISLDRADDMLTLVMEIKNARAGHTIPAGTVARRLVLEVRTVDAAGNSIETKKRVYRKAVSDAGGKEIEFDGDAYMYAKKVLSDNRLKPDEKRNETFIFTKKIKSIKRIEAESYFHYRPPVTVRTEMRIPLSSLTLPVRKK